MATENTILKTQVHNHKYTASMELSEQLARL